TPTGRMTNFAPGKGGIERDPRTLASHRFQGTQAAMLKGCLKVSLKARRDADGLLARLVVRADEVGHLVPTGFADRNLVLIFEPIGNDGRRLAGTVGPTLPRAAGKGYVGLPGRLYAKLLRDSGGSGPVPFWQSPQDVADTRLLPGQADVAEFRLPVGVKQVRLRLVFHRIWQDVADQKNWPDNETRIIEE